MGIRTVIGAASLLLPLGVVAEIRPVGTEFQVNTYTHRSQRDPAVAVGADGSFLVAWSSPRDGENFGVFAQRYDSAGQAVGEEFQVNTYTEAPQRSPAMAAGGDGTFVVVWASERDNGGYGVFGQRYDSVGQVVGTEFQVNTYTRMTQGLANVAAGADGTVVVVWISNFQDESSWGVFGQRYDSAGHAVGREFQVNTHTRSSQSNPAVAVGEDGSFVVVWDDVDRDGSVSAVFGQLYDRDGQPVGGEFQVNTHTEGFQASPAVAAGVAGAFVVVWHGDQKGYEVGVAGQRYDTAGRPLGTEFRINTYTWDLQEFPAIAAGTDGAFVVVWQSGSQDGDYRFGGYSVFGQRYDSAGRAVGTEFQVNSYTPYPQVYPALGMAADGGFVVVWSSGNYYVGQDGRSEGVFGQRFAEATSVPTATSTVSATPAPSATPTPAGALLPSATGTPRNPPSPTPEAIPSGTATHTAMPTLPASPTPTVPTPITCDGDCGGDGIVSIDELIAGVAIALGQRSVDDCAAFDIDNSDQITIDELVAAVDAALNECSD